MKNFAFILITMLLMPALSNAGVGGGGTTGHVMDVLPADQVLSVSQDKSECVFQVAHAEDQSVETIRLRPEEMTPDMSPYLEALQRSSLSQQWESIRQ